LFAVAATATVLAITLPAPVVAASPSAPPSVEPSDLPPERPEIQAWLDGPLPTDAEPGSTIDVGATLWDPAGPEIPQMGATIFVRLVPPAGAGDPVRATAIRDWLGHYVAHLAVPPGGIDRVEIGIEGTMCENDVCRPDDWLFEVPGAGPPPDAPITSLAEARIDVADETVAAGRPTGVSVSVEPNADWSSFPLPPEIVVRAREARGANLSTASLPLVDPTAFRYEGTITIPRAGDLVLEAALDADGGDATRFGTSMVRVPVEAGSGGGDGTATPGGAPGDEGLPTIVVVLLALVGLVFAGVILTGFRSGSR
jgi:hypothetical protein